MCIQYCVIYGYSLLATSKNEEDFDAKQRIIFLLASIKKSKFSKQQPKLNSRKRLDVIEY